MKSIFKILIITLLFTACKDDDTLPVDFDDLIVSGGPFATQIATDGLASVNKIDITPDILSGFTRTYELNSLQDGQDITKVEIFVGFDGQNANVAEALYFEIGSDEFDNTNELPEFSVDFRWSDVLSLLGLTLDDTEGGDNFNFRLALTNADGTFTDVSANFDNQSADHTFPSPVVCLEAPISGDWVLEMTDLFGDGWNGGEITVNIDGETSTYAAEGAGSTATINIPDGTAIFTFTYSSGDWEGENLYTLTNPDGLVILDEGVGDFSFANGPTEGELLNKCPN